MKELSLSVGESIHSRRVVVNINVTALSEWGQYTWVKINFQLISGIAKTVGRSCCLRG